MLARILLLLALLVPSAAFGHALGVTEVSATFDDGRFVVEVEAHPSPLGAAQIVPDLFGKGEGVVIALRPDDGGGGTVPIPDPESDIDVAPTEPVAHRELPDTMLRGIFERDRPVRFDGVAADAEVSLGDPDAEGVRKVRLTGTVPDGVAIFRWHAPAELGVARVRATVGANESAMDVWVEAGKPTQPLIFAKAEVVEGGPGLITWAKLGFLHILPRGLDHVLFVLGLFLFGAALRPLLLQVTAFTVAHAITLGLAVTGVVSLPATVVEPAIALSIVIVALENLRPRDDDAVPLHRLAVVFVFGLLHGAGFAGVLSELGLETDDTVATLVGFHLGVEAGQLAVLAGAFVLVGWARKRPT